MDNFVGEKPFSFRDFIPPEKDDEMLMNGLKDEYRDKGLEEGRKVGLKEGRKEGRKVGLKEGRKEGIEQNKLDTAKKMLELDMPIETIIKVTGLSKNQINELETKND